MSAPNELQVQVQWVDDGSPVVVVNQFLLQQHNDQVQLVVGHVGFPLVVGTPEEQREQVRQMGSLPVHVRARFLLDKTALANLHAILNKAVPEGEEQEADDE